MDVVDKKEYIPHTCVHKCACSCVYKRLISGVCLFTSFSETECLTDSGTHGFQLCRSPGICLPLTSLALGLQVSSWLWCECWDPTSGLHAFVARTLPEELSPSPQFLALNTIRFDFLCASICHLVLQPSGFLQVALQLALT